MKYSTITGVVPSIPLSDDHTDGTWTATDLYVGEIFLNVADNLAWWRSQTGLIPFGGTGASGPFIGDFVPASIGGTYGGPIYGPTASFDNVEGDNIIGGTGTFSGPVSATAFFGDGSGLTGINATWNGGVVGGTSTFQSDVTFETKIIVDEIESTGGTAGPIQINSPVVIAGGATVNGPVQAVTFIGDGSQLTGITGGTDTYTTAATLVGNTIQFDTNTTVNAYSVDLTPIASAPVTQIGWDDTLNEFTLELADGTIFTLPITQFTDLIVQGSVTADYFIGDGSLLTNLPTSTGPTGPQGPTGPVGPTGASGSTPYMVISYASTGLTLALGTVTLPITSTLYIGWNTGTRLRLWHSSTQYMEGVITSSMTYPQVAGNDITVLIDFVVGTGTPGSWLVGIAGDQASTSSLDLAAVLSNGNDTGNNWIEVNISGSGANGIRNNDPLDKDKKIEFSSDGILSEVYGNVSDNLSKISIVEDNITLLSKSDTSAFPANESFIELYQNGNIVINNTNALDISSEFITIGGQTPATFVGAQYDLDYSTNYTNRSLVDKEYVDSRPTPNLQSVLQSGNTSGNNNIVFANNFGLENSSGEADIKMNAFQIEVEHRTYPVNPTDWKRANLVTSGNNGVAQITGDEWNVTSDLYKAGYAVGANTYARLAFQETQISTGNGYLTLIQTNKDNILVDSAYNSTLANSNFRGIQYNHDYSAQFTVRSLVDKGYVDAAIAGATGGGGSQTLEQTLALGNSAGIYNINLNNNDLQNVDNTTTTTLNINSVVTGTSHKNLGLDNTGRVVQVGNSSYETFVYSFPNALDSLDFYNDGLVKFGWDAPGNDLEFYMLTEPAGASDLRALATLNYGIQQNTFITTPNLLYDLYGAGVAAGSQLTVMIVAETDLTYPIYQVELYNASSNVTVKIIKTKKI